MRSRLLKNMNPTDCFSRNYNCNMIGICSEFRNQLKLNNKRY